MTYLSEKKNYLKVEPLLEDLNEKSKIKEYVWSHKRLQRRRAGFRRLGTGGRRYCDKKKQTHHMLPQVKEGKNAFNKV